jgi:hypothetical protein
MVNPPSSLLAAGIFRQGLGALVLINLFFLKKAKVNTVHLAAHAIFEKRFKRGEYH